MATKKFYVIWAGRNPGIYDNWSEAERQVKGFAGAKFKGFPSKAEAEAAFAGSPSSSGTGQSRSKPTGKATASRTSSSKVAVKPEGPQADLEIYCDGACDPNPGKAGTGIVIYEAGKTPQLWYGLFNPRGTNNTAELLGLHHSLLMAKAAIAEGKSVVIHCDSSYSIKAVTEWSFGWKAKGWTRKGDPLLNLDLIRPAHELYVDIADGVRVRHIKAHAGIEGNELADRMSMVAVQRREPELRRFDDGASVVEILAMERG